LRRLDPSLELGAAFYLSIGELVSATARTRADLGAQVRMRRASFAREIQKPDPPETFVGVPPRLATPSFDARELHGATASGGLVTGRARLIGASGTGAERVQSGDILVVRTPDVALAPLFFWAGALVSDAGSALSHAAVVAREVGVPAVLGVPGATTTIRDGELLRVDGDLGVVERLEG
jgi:pyruvate,water dikinase